MIHSTARLNSFKVLPLLVLLSWLFYNFKLKHLITLINMPLKSHQHSFREHNIKPRKPLKVQLAKLWLTAYNGAALIAS